jgi:hypothetical protein
VALYVITIASTLVSPWIAFALYMLMAIVSLVPDRRMRER